MNTASPDCTRCKHFYLTWRHFLSRGCRAYGFQSERYPSQVVLSGSGEPCGFFAAKPPLLAPEQRSARPQAEAS